MLGRGSKRVIYNEYEAVGSQMPPRMPSALPVSGRGGGPPNVRGFMKSDEKHRVLSSNMFVSVLNFLCIPQIGRLPAHGPNVKRLLIPRSVLLSGLLRIEEIEKAFLTEMSKNRVLKKTQNGLAYSGKS